MAVDVTPPLEPGAKVIDSYGPGRFKIAEEIFETSVIVLPDRVIPWDVKDASELDYMSFQPIFAQEEIPEVLILGCGDRVTFISPALRQQLRERGCPPDFMDTGAACRTYNILLGEGRRVAAALIALPES